MRTTLDIDEDVLEAAKERARRESKTAGQVVSELLRQALTARPPTSTVAEQPAVYGFRPFPPGETVITNALLDELRHDDAFWADDVSMLDAETIDATRRSQRTTSG